MIRIKKFEKFFVQKEYYMHKRILFNKVMSFMMFDIVELNNEGLSYFSFIEILC